MTTSEEYKTWDRAVMLPIKSLVFTDWNTNEMSSEKLAELTSDIENLDDPGVLRFDEPIQVVPIKGQNKWLVIGGEHRTKVMTALNQDEVPCVIRTDLADKTRRELMLWSVRRNNSHGQHNAQKYAELENELVNDHGMDVEAARRTMLIDGDLAKALAASTKIKNKDSSSDDNASSAADVDFDASSVKEEERKHRDRSELLQALKIAEQDVLLDSADTAEFGYLFFAQGRAGVLHLVVDCPEELIESVKKLVNVCKGEKERIANLLQSAIDREIEEHR